MRGWRLAAGLLLLATFGFGTLSEAAEPEQFFASVLLDKKKIGQFHVRVSRAETGEIEELQARASVSMLKIKLYEFTHDLTQTWRAGELQKLQGMADDNGTKYELQLTRKAQDYSGEVNKKPVTLPIEAFPNSIWHYGIVNHSLLFNEVDLKLLKVTMTQGGDIVDLDKKKIPADRVTIKGDFAATVWLTRTGISSWQSCRLPAAPSWSSVIPRGQGTQTCVPSTPQPHDVVTNLSWTTHKWSKRKGGTTDES